MYAIATATNNEKVKTAQTMLEAKANLFAVLVPLGGTLSPWEPTGDQWAYANLQLNHAVIRVGVSTGGVVAVNGRPFSPDMELNVTMHAVRKSIQHVADRHLCCTSCGRSYAANEITGAEYVEFDVGVCPDSDCSGRDPNDMQTAM